MNEVLRKLIENGKIKEVLDMLEKIDLSENLKMRAQIAKVDYNRLQKDIQNNVITRELRGIEETKISRALLEIIDKINSPESELEGKLFGESVNDKSLKDESVNGKRRGLKAYSMIGVLSLLFLCLLFFINEKYNKSEFTYCIVAKSFKVYSNAENYKKLLIKDGYKDAEILLQKNGSLYVTCYMEFSNEKDAFYEMEKLKANERNDEIWIYKYK
ncbi:MAG: hypothetical protein P1U56_25780 [Saprospiraceae bacterium]|nr:hypothetical protein [Saprospiraceae bacterium]